MENWLDACGPSIDRDSTHQDHQGAYSIAPFQTRSRYFYAPVGEDCCGRQFVELFYQQHHPFPHCSDCARMVLGNASHICWQCRTYFRRYGTGTMQQIMGVTPQRHNLSAIMNPARGPHQQRLPEEKRAQKWRKKNLKLVTPPILQVLLPEQDMCQFWTNVSGFLEQFQNHRCLVDLPTIPMPYFSVEARLPLPSSPWDIRSGLSLHLETIKVHSPENADIDPPSGQD